MEFIDPLLNQPLVTEIADIEVTNLTETEVNNEFSKNFVYSGYSVELALPIAKNSNEAIFAINLDGFIPGIDFSGKKFFQMNRNMCPVQVLPHATSFTKVSYTPIPFEILSKFMTYRNVQGNVNVILRSSTNVGQTGNIIISQASGCQRLLYTEKDNYSGVRFMNIDSAATNFMQSGTTLWDLSLSRNCSITTKFRNNLPATDLMQKINMFGNFPAGFPGQVNDFISASVTSQFPENWLLFTPQNSLPETTGKTITIGIYFDYSQLIFSNPGLPILASPPRDKRAQIMDWTATFLGLPSFELKDMEDWRTKIKWLPGGWPQSSKPPIKS
jgi:hypothetical protein